MKVQRIRLPETDQVSWLVLDDEYVPIQPILAYLTFLRNLDRSPNTMRSTTHHLKLYWEYLRDEYLDWAKIDIPHLAAFITWLRRPDPAVISIAPRTAQRTNATIDQILSAVHEFYIYHMRVKTIPPLSLWELSMPSRRRYKPFLYGTVKTKPEHLPKR